MNTKNKDNLLSTVYSTGTVQTMECANCDRLVQDDEAVKYLLSDLDSEVLAWVEENLQNEVTEDSFLCGECFERLTMKMWSELHEPEVIQLSRTEVEGPDPLSEVEVKIEDTQIKEEQSTEDLEISIEDKLLFVKDSKHNFKEAYGQILSQNENINESNSDDDVEISDQNIGQKDNSDDESLHEYASDDSWRPDEYQVKKVGKGPPTLDRSTLSAQAKCDSCNADIAKKPYQLLPEGPEKIIISEGQQDKSPRVYCQCWDKVHSLAANKLDKLQEVESIRRTFAETDKYITIPGYQRLPNTSNNCIVKGCKSKDKRRLPTYLRKVIFTDCNIYIKPGCRICHEHRKEFNRDWSFLKEQPTNIDSFNAVNVEEMLDFLRDDALHLPE